MVKTMEERSVTTAEHDDDDDEDTAIGNAKRTDESLHTLIGSRSKPRFSEMVGSESVKTAVRDAHRAYLGDKVWKDLDPGATCVAMVDAIKDGVKRVCRAVREDHRYKFIVQTYVSEFNLQSMLVKCRCLWDANTDRLVFESYNDGRVVCFTHVIFVYFY